MKMMMSVVAIACAAGAAQAAFDLQITEMWMGNEPGANLTEDWFEVTNFGDMDFTFGVDGYLFFDDESADWEAADILEGIGTIAAGETVIFVDEGQAAAGAWFDVWFDIASDVPGVDGVPQVGWYDGSGLGQGGDAVALFLDADQTLDAGSTAFEVEAFPDADFNGGQSWDSVLGAFSTVGNASGAYATDIVNDEGQNAIASPGTIPAPGAMAVLAFGGIAAVRRRR